jgi:hypothetical protein
MFPSSILIVLASFDYESLQITLKSLDHTLMNEEKVIIILNGNHSLNSRIVEYVARKWSEKKAASRYVIRPLEAPRSLSLLLRRLLTTVNILKPQNLFAKLTMTLFR